MTEFTTNLTLKLPDFNLSPWHDMVNDNFIAIDAAIHSATGMTGIVGFWQNSTAYAVADKVIDVDSNTVWRCLVAHTSHASNTFLQDRTANPTFWQSVNAGISFRGAWTTATAYAINDQVYDTTERVVAIALTNHTSGANIRTDEAAGNWEFMADLSTILLTSIPTDVYFRDTVDNTKRVLVKADNVTAGENWSIQVGKGVDVASASTLVLGSGNLFQITGAVTINDIDFTDAYNGRWAILRFSGAAAIINSANLFFPGAASFTTAANDMLLVVQVAGDMVQVFHYQSLLTPPPSVFFATLFNDANAGAVFTTLGISAFVQTLLDDAAATNFLTTLGFSTFFKTLVDDADAATVFGTLGISAFIQTLLDDTTAVAALTTLGVTVGSYTPTLFNTTNVAASTANVTYYVRIGDTVIVFGNVDIDPTAAAPTVTLLGMSLPVASALTAAPQLSGVCVGYGFAGAEAYGVHADAANDRASFDGAAVTVANHSHTFIFAYKVL